MFFQFLCRVLNRGCIKEKLSTQSQGMMESLILLITKLILIQFINISGFCVLFLCIVQWMACNVYLKIIPLTLVGYKLLDNGRGAHWIKISRVLFSADSSLRPF